MPDLKISQLASTGVVNDTDEMVLARGGATFKAQASLIRAAAIAAIQATNTAQQVEIDQAQVDIDALETELGLNPSGAYADVATRLNAMEALIAAQAALIEALTDRVEALENAEGGGGGSPIYGATATGWTFGGVAPDIGPSES